MSTEALNEETASENVPLVTHQYATQTRAIKALRAGGRCMSTNLLLLLTIASVFVGVALGVGVREAHPGRLAHELIALPGEIFLRMLKMLILPLIVFSLIAGLGSLDVKVAGALGWRTVVYYFTTTFLAVALGLLLVMTIRPGSRNPVEPTCNNASSSFTDGQQLETLDSILDLIRNLLPDNLFQATFSQAQTRYSYENVTNWRDCISDHNNTYNCSEVKEIIAELNLTCGNATRELRRVTVGTREGMNVLGIIIFSIAFSVVLARLGPEGAKVVRVISTLNEAIMKLVGFVMWYSPVGIASIIAGKLLEVDSFATLVEQVGLYFATVMVGLTLHGVVVLPLIYLLLTRKNPLKVVQATLQALLTAFGTSSSSATLPVTIRCLEENFGADSRVTRFMLPVGATINMDGTALYEAVAAVFIAQVENYDTSPAKVIIICITAIAASVGAAGVPQAGLFTLVIVLVAVGLPPEDAALILAVDWLLDRFRTTVNVLGDSFGVGIVQHFTRKHLEKSPTIQTPTDLSLSSGSSSDQSTTSSVKGFGGYGGTVEHSPPSSRLPQWSHSTQTSERPQVYMSCDPELPAAGESSQTASDGSLTKEESAL